MNTPCHRTQRKPFCPLSLYVPTHRDAIKAQKSSEKLYEREFRIKQGNSCISLEGLTLDDLDTEEKQKNVQYNIKCFATFLLHHKWDGSSFYKCDSLTTILSGLVNNLKNKFPNIEIFQVGDKRKGIPPHPKAMWYIDLLHGLKTTSRVAAIKRGESISGSSNSIRYAIHMCYICNRDYLS